MASIVLFLAMAAYIGLYIAQASRERVQTSPAVTTTVTDSGEAAGVIVREEIVLSTARDYVYVEAGDGERISAGSVAARGMDSQEALDAAGRVRELTKEIARVRTLLGGVSTASGLTERDAAIRASIYDLSRCSATGDLSALSSAGASLSTLLFSSSASVTAADLAALEDELKSVSGSAFAGSAVITAPDSGLFTTEVDGLEGLTPQALEGITPSGVEELTYGRVQVPDSVFGKLVTGYRWYYACVMESQAADKLSAGSYAYLSLGRRYGGDIQARVDYVSESEGGRRAVVFSSLRSLGETLASRELSAQVIFNQYTGLRVPVKALHVTADGETYVYVITAQRVEKKLVEILTRADDYYLVEAGDAADSLREGNEVVVGGRQVTEGMYVG